MKMLLYFILFLFTFRLTMVVGTFQGAKPGCPTNCGYVTVPYPFGIGTECSLDQRFSLFCNTSYESPKLFIGKSNIQTYNISDSELRILTKISYQCYNESGYLENGSMRWTDLAWGFSYSAKNKFTVIGCDDYALIAGTRGSNFTSGCFGVCREPPAVHDGQCLGVGCCQISVPKGFSYFNVTFGSLQRHSEVWYFNKCGYSFLVEEGFFRFRGAADLNASGMDFVDEIRSNSLSVLDWVIAPNGSCADEVNTCQENSLCYDVDGGGYRCRCNKGYEGNPYLHPGCQDINECDDVETYRCHGTCANTVGSYSCSYDNIKKRLSTIYITIGVSMGVFFLVAIMILPKKIKKSNQERQRKRFFTRNGGLLLKQQEEADPSLVDKTILFTSRELEKATENFNENRILGRGGHGTVYKGMLVDGRIVAVKKSKIVDESELEQFINEVVILSQVIHRNVVKLLGCCLETEVPLLVSEFIPNGTLYDHLHNETENFPISLNMRLQIAAEVAGAVAYLHSATSMPIYHRDIKTSNILLDEKYRAKVSDFGTSRFVSREQTHLTTIVKGTFGYLDPEYFQSSQFTEKSDVYSFGVVLVELLTREKPISLTKFGENRSLATHFMIAMEEGRVMSIFDTLVVKEGSRDDLLALANLAARCLNLNGKYRPTMKEVAAQLETIRASHIPSVDETNSKHVMHPEELLMLPYGESSSTFMSFNDSSSR